jgi:ribonuclease BN (tRNA processing enzyme)
VHGCDDGETALGDILSGQMAQRYFPVDFGELSARISLEPCPPEGREIEGVAVRPFPLSHPGGGCGFRFETEDKTVIFLTDNELDTGGLAANRAVLEFVEGADLLIHDAQYTPEDIESHRGWGHSCYVDVVELALYAQVRHLVLSHHDPDRSDEQVDDISNAARAQVDAAGGILRCDAAAEGAVIHI